MQRPITHFPATATSDMIEGVKISEMFQGSLNCGGGGLGLRGIPGEGFGGFAQSRFGLGNVFGIAPDYDHLSTCLRKGFGRREPQASSATNNDNYFIGEFQLRIPFTIWPCTSVRR